jgi:signal transduction histidine kinase
VLGFAELLHLDGVTHPALDQIQRNGRTLLGMIDDLLELGRLTTPDAETDGARSSEAVIGEVVANLQHVARERGARLMMEFIDREPSSVADPLRLRQALHCLISSALVAAGRRGVVRVGEIPGDHTSQGVTRIRLTATGPEHLAIGGLGLALARSFVDALDGDFDVEERQGTTQIVVSAGRTRGRTPRHGAS